MEDREFSKVVGRLKEACRQCIKLKEDCRECPYQGDCIKRKHKDTLYVIGKYEEMLWTKTAEVEQLKKEGVWVFAAEAGGPNVYDTDFTGACAIVMGSEG